MNRLVCATNVSGATDSVSSNTAPSRARRSIAGVATQHSVNPQNVVNALVSAVDARVNQAVTAGKLTSTQASTIEARLPTVLTKVVDHTF